MTLSIPISTEVETLLKARAAAAGTDLTSYVTTLVEQATQPVPSISEISGPVAGDFAATGMTDEELWDVLEKAKHNMRAEQRVQKGS